MTERTNETSSFLNALNAQAKDILDELRQVRLSVRETIRDIRNTVDESRAHMKSKGHPVSSLGEPHHDVIDLGAKKGLPKRILQGGVATIVLALMAGGAAAFALFALQIAVAFLLAVSILGIRIDMNPSAFTNR
jgi:hypothetical protein